MGQARDRVTLTVDRERVATLPSAGAGARGAADGARGGVLEAARKAGLELKRAPSGHVRLADPRSREGRSEPTRARAARLTRALQRLGAGGVVQLAGGLRDRSRRVSFGDPLVDRRRGRGSERRRDVRHFEFPSSVSASSAIELAFEGELGATLISLPGGRARAAFRTTRGFDEIQDVEHLRRLAKARLPGYEGVGDEIDWGLMTHFERRLVRRFGVGRVWLAGDAAHVTSPFGGQSMNAGLREGDEYVSRIAGAASAAEARRAFGLREAQIREWYRLLGVNVTFELLPHAPAWLKDHARRILPALPATVPEIDGLLRELGVAIH